MHTLMFPLTLAMGSISFQKRIDFIICGRTYIRYRNECFFQMRNTLQIIFFRNNKRTPTIKRIIHLGDITISLIQPPYPAWLTSLSFCFVMSSILFSSLISCLRFMKSMEKEGRMKPPFFENILYFLKIKSVSGILLYMRCQYWDSCRILPMPPTQRQEPVHQTAASHQARTHSTPGWTGPGASPWWSPARRFPQPP